MPIASIKIGVDLDPIPAIKGCVTFQCDITTQKCMTLIKKELKHFKADIVLNDGAPNVGANWSMDAYNQIELSLYALKVATETLRRGGWFITKVFRSKDYNALMYVANQLFTKVESNKPQSSRGTSAEIFMVCQGFKAPDIIDPKLLDPKYALEQVEDENPESNDKVTSLKKLLKYKKNRSGYETETNILYTETDLSEFLLSADPHEYLSSFNKFRIDKDGEDMIKDLKAPSDLTFMCEDLKVCGRREFQELLKLRYKYQVSLERKKMAIKDAKRAEEEANKPEMTQEELEALVDKELDNTIKRVEREKKKAEKKEKVKEQKQDIRKKMSVIAASSLNNDEDLILDRRTWDKLKQVEDAEDIQKYIPKNFKIEDSDDENMDPTLRKFNFLNDGTEKKVVKGEESSDDISEDE